MKKRIEQIILSAVLIFCAVMCGRDIYTRYAEFLQAGRIVPTFIFICAVLVGGTLFMAALIWLKPGAVDTFKNKLGIFGRILAVLVCAAPGVLYNFMNFSEPWRGLWIRVFVCGLAVIAASWLWERNGAVSFASVIPCALVFAASFALLTQFHDVSDYPFSIGWSEGNRMWDYSVLFGKDLYNYPQDQTIPAYIDIGRQSLWGLIYLLPNVSIVGARVWNDVLFTIPCALLGWALLRRNPSCRGVRLLAVSLWAMLFLMQGPIYTPLTLAAVLVALGSRLPLVLNCVLVAAAGFYAVMSRSTWVAAPSAFAVFLCFLDQSAIADDKAKKSRWGKAVALGLSGLIGAAVYMKREVFAGLFGSSAEVVTEAAAETTAAEAAIEAVPQIFTPAWFQYYLGRQALLWDRLWPNETYKPGIVLGLALAVLPLILLIVIWAVRKHWKLDGWQKLLLFAGLSLIHI